jgi:hypothetical protein
MPKETHQQELWLDEVGTETIEKLIGGNLSKEIVEQQFSDETAELESVAEWPVSVTRDESRMGDQEDLSME